MSSRLIKDFYRKIHLDDLTIAYSGSFSDTMTEKIIELSEAYLEANEHLGKMKRRTSFLVAECFQNVVRHSSKDLRNSESEPINESFFLRFYGSKCFIASENLIPTDQVQDLKGKLDLVNQYEKSKLRDFYRTMLEEGKLSDKGGAGLGLIEMARKTGNKIMYSFDPKDDKFSLFYLMLVLENVQDENMEQDHSADLDQLKIIVKNIQEDNIFLLYKGDFGEEIISHIEKIIEKNLDSQQDSLAKKIKLYHAAIMTMHKIGTYSLDKGNKQSGMFFIGRDEGRYTINATFPVNKEIKEQLGEILGEIKDATREELVHIYQEKLMYKTKEKVIPPGLGFMQLILIGKSWDFEFDRPEGLPEELVYQIYV